MRVVKLILLFLTTVIVSCQVKETNSATSTYEFQLSNPRIEIDSALFNQQARVTLALDYPGVEIYYSLDNQEVTKQNKKYESPLIIDKSSQISVRAYHSDFLPSEITTREAFKINDFSSKANVSLDKPPHANYSGKGAKSLIDLHKGTTVFRNGDDWLGFQDDFIDIRLNFDVAEKIESVSISSLQDHGSWIFLPEKIQIMSQGQLVTEELWKSPEAAMPTQLKFLAVQVPNGLITDNITVRVFNSMIPKWHAGVGTPAWFFIDEVLIN